MSNKKTGEYAVTMKLRQIVPELRVEVTSQTHLMAIRLAAALHPAYEPLSVELDGQTWHVFGSCVLCGCYILWGDRFARHGKGVECCECRAGAPAGRIASALTAPAKREECPA